MEEKQQIGALFDRIAGTYDGLNHGLSMNIDKSWRRRAVEMMPPARHVLDVAIGTADLAIEMLRTGKAELVTGLDLSEQMMAVGKEKVARSKMGSKRVEFIYGNAQEMPFADETFDGVTCAFGCRNFSDLDAGLREMHRVLKRGGQVTILEFSYPTRRYVRALYDIYFSYVLPLIGRIVSRDKTAYSYLNKSVKGFCWGEAFVQHMHDAGFEDMHFEKRTFGIATIYTAIKNAKMNK
jgi:demethylmenaquinone methyltransferase/2-methoxy-6-polyprenyl-1,4-benzoquinol methylase